MKEQGSNEQMVKASELLAALKSLIDQCAVWGCEPKVFKNANEVYKRAIKAEPCQE